MSALPFVEPLTDRLRRLEPRTKRVGFLAAVVLVYGVALFVTDGLRFPAHKDEQHFAETSVEFFSGPFPPSVETLRSYPEVLTPLCFIIWGQLERATGHVLESGRALNLLLGLAVLAAVAFGWGPRDRGRGPGARDRSDGSSLDARLLAAIGVLAFPYFVPMGVHMYSDMVASFLLVAGMLLHLRGHPWPAFAVFAAAISARQYSVVGPAALAAWELVAVVRGERGRVVPMVTAGLACATLLGWFAFYGGLAPQPGIERWVPQYPAPMTETSSFMVGYGLYFLACLGVYFVIPEWLMFHRRFDVDEIASFRTVAVWLGLGILFMWFPPVYETGPGGVVDRFLRIFFPLGWGDAPRIACFVVLATWTVLRFSKRLDLGFWLVAAQFVLIMKSQLPWDKYAMPVVVLLWLLKAEGELDGEARARR